MVKSDPLKSEGARLERKAILAKVRRMKKPYTELTIFDAFERWILARRARYDKKPGGLGK